MVHQMLMYSSICRHTNQNSDHAICKMIIAGFTGQLRGWWDNFLSSEEKYAITNAYKEEVKRELVTGEDGKPVERLQLIKLKMLFILLFLLY